MALKLKNIIPAVLVTVAPVAAFAQASDPAATQIDAYHNAIIEIMKQGKSLGISGRITRFETLVHDYYDMPTMTSLVVGSGWSSASQADRDQAIAALEHHSAVMLASNFVSYGGEQFKTELPVTSRGSDKLVRATITSDKLIYRMRFSQGKWRIVDIISDGVSQLAVQRADFSSTVASNGIPGLVHKLATIDAKTMK
ncbi:hopanoid biosynthesis associated membrane protein HpnM [Zymomonas mobilis subsp. mobilis ZM4 = ATCC 31821]|uniref:Hopanoid biosynthesis associated membrane protein HpnM n=1 Tax=Zymomonas mobilis subsp. mobilis (strain ATCC 31821 / ZM4 / CP4) TaxID=264203 RepID=Q5NP60_ZYMMO|nr:HpnM family protein [Zymomonas mobilis]AAV89500.1 hopanoid biosynthesis associated membrane protein HpnM [Zymomonas mobilis subsp. mobilis ZM4 = ATCC 31821]ACV74966.1 hopanoid biosynthesis associated membrane protein HpnM [Zymomonas mobilis subsp. mobilis NCIMB 11163]AVZ25801.1 hopanoid biosynthesis associated membrane protein HpnM [Zymomonas mobilis subsp. mobilis]AVZ27692.1 hopanoid biosynthesis associated membrane protein HpnM [Zymomonas mobilis subsp. mobilis]AVZ42138.1 hopanoid biosynt